MPTRRRRAAHLDDVVLRGEALEVARSLPEGCCDLIYIDPPFCTGTTRAGRGRAARFDDHWNDGLRSYLEFMRPRLLECRRLLAPRATIWVHLDWRAVHHVKVLMDELYDPANFLNEVIWHYRTGGVARRWLSRKHDTILVYARQAGAHQFHVLRGGAYRTDGLKYDGDRPYKQTRRGRLYFHADGAVLDDVWEIPFLSTVARERTGWPAQKPQALLERIVTIATRPGDRVADFFCGSGTTLAAARSLNRRYIGCDISHEAVRITARRLGAPATRKSL